MYGASKTRLITGIWAETGKLGPARTLILSSTVFTPFRNASRVSFRVSRRNVVTSTVDWKPIKSSKTVQKKNSRLLSALLFASMLAIPIAAFGLGTWQVQRLQWKSELITKAEHRLTLPPLPLPSGQLDADAIDEDFDYRKVTIEGTFVHEQEMLVGPRIHNGRNGFNVVTPMVRKSGTKVLIARGWIDEQHKDQSTRKAALPTGPQKITALLRKKPQKNRFTADGKPLEGMYHFLDIDKMAELTQSQNVYIEQVVDDSESDLLDNQKIIRGIPIPATGKVELRNSHFQYILTWYGLCAVTTFMFFHLIKQRRMEKLSAVKRKLAHEKRTQL